MTIHQHIKIGLLAKLTGTTAPTIRYYEQIELLPRPHRLAGHQRSYSNEDVARLTFIRRCRDFDFPIDDVRELVRLMDDPSRDCNAMQDIGQSQLDVIRNKLSELRTLEKMLTEFVDRCAKTCAGGPVSNCLPLAELARSSPGKSPASRSRRTNSTPSRSRRLKS